MLSGIIELVDLVEFIEFIEFIKFIEFMKACSAWGKGVQCRWGPRQREALHCSREVLHPSLGRYFTAYPGIGKIH